ncbi:MAG: heavy metal translocating P-type ATPase [Ardenticatenaceae bacterium]
MLITNALIASSTISALYVGVKAIKEDQKRKKTPWTYYAEKMDKKRRRRGKKSAYQSAIEPNIFPAMAMPSVGLLALTKFKEEKIKPLFADSRSEQLKEISATLDEEKTQDARRLTRELTISLVSLSFASAGPLFYSPLSYLSIPGICWLGVGIYKDFYFSLKEKQGVGMALYRVMYITGTLATGNYFAAALGSTLYRVSRKVLSKTEDHSRQSLINVFGNQKRFVWLIRDDFEVEVLVEALKSGDIIVAHAGETIAVDGTITFGTASIDQRILTGESQPTEKEVGDQVFASTVVLSGQIKICVEKAGASTVAAQIGEILNQTADFKSSIQSWGEQIGEMSAQMTLGLSGLLFPFLGADTALAILNASLGRYMVVLGPLSMLSFLNLTSQQGILVKDGRSLQLLTKVDTVVFDKTGTLTMETPHVGKIHTCLGFGEEQLLTVAAAAEYKQTHPIALAIRRHASVALKASEGGLRLPEISDANYEVGYGLKVTIAHPDKKSRGAVLSQLVRVGSKRFMARCGIVIPPDITAQDQESDEHGHSLVYVAIDDQLAGAIELHATIRPEAKQVVSELRKRNMDLVIISGDHEKPTRQLAQELGIEHYFAETLPENKADLISKLQEQGKSVCFVGDGINDSIALKAANVSISLRGASSAATDTAQIVLMKQDLNQLLQLFDVAHDFERNMKANLVTTIVPGVITLFGAFFLGFGVVHSVIVNNIGNFIGASNAVWPWFKEGKKLSESPKP